MSGTRFQRKAQVVTFPPEHELHGLEVVCRRPSVGAIEAVNDLAVSDDEKVSTQVMAIVDTLFAPALISWNYHDEIGYKVPATAEGLRQLDIEALLYVLSAWTDGIQGVTPDLGKESDSGHSSPGPKSIPVTGTPGLSNALASLHALPVNSPFLSASPDTPSAH